MAISSQNTNLNQYVPPMCVHAPVAGQTFLYNSCKRIWENRTILAADLGGIAPEDLVWQGGIFGPGDVVTISNDLATFVSTPRSLLGGPGTATTLNDLTDVTVISPILANQVLIYDINTSMWKNSYVSYDDLTSVPTEFPPAFHTHTVDEITDLTTYYYDKTEVDGLVNTKVNLVPGVAGDFSMLDGTGQLVDSGYTALSFATAAQGTLANTALQPGDNIGQLINNVGYITNINAFSIDALIDVNTTGAQVGQVLKWNGTNWVPSTDNDTILVSSVFGRTGDVIAIAGDYSANMITYSNVSSGLTATTAQGAIDELDVKIDVNTANIATNTTNIATNTTNIATNTTNIATNTTNIAINAADIDTLQNAGYITNISSFSINDLNDVNTAGVANNSILVWQSGEFIVLGNTFLVQTDTPTSYAGAAGMLVAVNTAETALEFINVIDGGTY